MNEILETTTKWRKTKLNKKLISFSFLDSFRIKNEKKTNKIGYFSSTFTVISPLSALIHNTDISAFKFAQIVTKYIFVFKATKPPGITNDKMQLFH